MSALLPALPIWRKGGALKPLECQFEAREGRVGRHRRYVPPGRQEERLTTFGHTSRIVYKRDDVKESNSKRSQSAAKIDLEYGGAPDRRRRRWAACTPACPAPGPGATPLSFSYCASSTGSRGHLQGCNRAVRAHIVRAGVVVHAATQCLPIRPISSDALWRSALTPYWPLPEDQRGHSCVGPARAGPTY